METGKYRPISRFFGNIDFITTYILDTYAIYIIYLIIFLDIPKSENTLEIGLSTRGLAFVKNIFS
jgi:hypothetical protein